MSRPRPSVTFAAVAVAASACLGLFGCGGGNDERAEPSDPTLSTSTSTTSTTSAQAPAFDADAGEVQSYLSGSWRLMLLPEAGELDVDAPSVSATFRVADFAEGRGMAQVATLSGSVANSGFSGGTATVMQDAAAYPTVTFQTDGVSVPSLTGEGTIDVPGPVEWTGTLVDGRLVGEATGPGGTAAWEARRQ